MGNYHRRTFLKHAAILTATAATNRLFLFNQASARPAGTWASEDLLKVDQDFSTLAQTVNKRGADHPFFTQANKRPEVIAHRGGDGQWPGETMYAYKRAMEIGVDVLEMDVYLTKDLHLVLMHDNDIRTTTNFKGRNPQVRNFKLTELKELNAAYKWSPGGSDCHPFRDDPNKDLKVTSLKEVFEKFSGTRMIIEMKEAAPGYSPASALSEIICKTRMWDKVLIASQSDDYLREFRGLCPEVATSASKRELTRFGLPGTSHKPNTDALQMIDKFWRIDLLTKEFVEKAHRANVNLPVHAWTVNNLERMRRIVDLGVDGIITDYPGPLLALLGRKAADVDVAPRCRP
jgi:glycerophosphoryl diester phosphodiesterase